MLFCVISCWDLFSSLLIFQVDFLAIMIYIVIIITDNCIYHTYSCFPDFKTFFLHYIHSILTINAYTHSAIIFIDELDAIGTKRYGGEQSGDREVRRKFKWTHIYLFVRFDNLTYNNNNNNNNNRQYIANSIID